jgi:hypothetical protein
VVGYHADINDEGKNVYCELDPCVLEGLPPDAGMITPPKRDVEMAEPSNIPEPTQQPSVEVEMKDQDRLDELLFDLYMSVSKTFSTKFKSTDV